MEMRDAVREACRQIQHTCARKPLLPNELADAVVFFDTVALVAGREMLDEFRALPDPRALALEIIREGRS